MHVGYAGVLLKAAHARKAPSRSHYSGFLSGLSDTLRPVKDAYLIRVVAPAREVDREVGRC